MGSIFKQTICTIIICYICMMMGVFLTWPSSTYKLFSSANTTLDHPMNEIEISLLGSLSSIGSLVTTPIIGLTLDRLGRKYTSIIIAMTYVVCWSLLAASNRVEVVLTSVFISGIGGCMLLVVPIYISEICQESIRGMMTCGFTLFYSIGMLVSYLMGGFLEYHVMIYTCLSFSVAGVALLFILKESPLLLMKNGREKEAAQAMAFYRSAKVDSKEVQQELDALRRSFNPIADDIPEDEEKLNLKKQETQNLTTWQFFKRSRSTQRAFVTTLVLFTAALFQGLLVVLVYAGPLFEEAIPDMSATVCSVVLALVTILASFIAGYVVQVTGRKVAMTCSSIGTGICCLLLGTQIHLKWGPPIIAAVIIYAFCILYTVGAGTVPFVFMVEVFLPEVKSKLTTILIEYLWIVNFTILFIFNPLVSAIGLGPVFYIFAGCCFSTSVFCYFFLPETKGLSVDAVQLLLINKK